MLVTFLKHLLQTPTLAFTSMGSLALIATLLFHVRHADVVATVFLGAAGGGVAIALYEETRRHGYEWGWTGLIQSLRRPSRWFIAGLLGHLPQLLVALYLLFRKRRATRPKKD